MKLLSPLLTRINRVISITAVSLTLFLCCLSVAKALDATNPTNRRILSVATVVQADERQAELIMKRLGYPPDEWLSATHQWRDFEKWPLERKLETAWLSAEEAKPGEGNRFLKAFVREIAKINHAIKKEPVLEGYFLEPWSEKREGFKFVAFWDIPAKKMAAGAPPEVQQIIKAVANHTGSYPGGTLHLVQRCCSIRESKAWELIRQSTSLEEALSKAIETGELPPEKAQRIAQLLREGLHFDAAIAAEIENPQLRQAMRQYVSKGSGLAQRQAIAQQIDHVVKNIMSSAKNATITLADDVSRKTIEILNEIPKQTIAETSTFSTIKASIEGSEVVSDLAVLAGNMPPSGNGSRSSDPISSSRVAKLPATRSSPSVASGAYRSFQIREYGGFPSSTARASGASSHRNLFRSMIGSRRGFGGIVFGEKISSDPAIAKPLTFTWYKLNQPRNKNDEEQGILVFVLDDGKRVYSPPMFASDLLAAINAVYGVLGSMKPLSEGEGLGLVGYTGAINDYKIVDGIVAKRDDVVAATFLVHPSMARSELGKAAIMVDAMPFLLKKRLFEIVQQDSIDPEQRQKFKAWLETKWSTYKFVDVPLEAKVDEYGVLHMVRSDKLPNGASESLRQTSFVTKVIFLPDGKTMPRSDSDELFYPISADFSVISGHFARINDFAQIFGLVRWAKSMGVDKEKIINLPEVKETSSDWSTIIINKEGTEIEFGPNKHVRARIFATKVEELAQSILAKDQNLVSLKKISHDILKKRFEQIAIDFLREVADSRVILNTHLNAEQIEAFNEKVFSKSMAIFNSRFQYDRLLTILNRGEMTKEEEKNFAIDYFNKTRQNQTNQALQVIANDNQEVDADLKRLEILKEQSDELAQTYTFNDPITFLRGFGQASLEKQRQELVTQRDDLQTALNSDKHSIALRYEFAPKNVQIKFEEAFSGYQSASNWVSRKYYEWWSLSDLPALNVEKVKEKIGILNKEIAKIDARLATLPSLEIANHEAFLELANHEAFKEWFRLQQSYVTECQSGACL